MKIFVSAVSIGIPEVVERSVVCAERRSVRLLTVVN